MSRSNPTTSHRIANQSSKRAIGLIGLQAPVVAISGCLVRVEPTLHGVANRESCAAVSPPGALAHETTEPVVPRSCSKSPQPVRGLFPVTPELSRVSPDFQGHSCILPVGVNLPLHHNLVSVGMFQGAHEGIAKGDQNRVRLLCLHHEAAAGVSNWAAAELPSATEGRRLRSH